jgi:AraC-like DNA-binding protein
VHQIRAASLYSYLDVAKSVGIDGFRLLADAGISPSALADAESRLPAEAATRLLERSAAQSNCDSFGLRMAQCRTFASLGAISLLLERLQNIGEVLEALATAGRALSDVVIVAIEHQAGTVLAKFGLVFNHSQAIDLSVGVAHIALSGASHGRWKPEVVHFTHGAPADKATFEQFFQAPLDFNCDFNGFSLSNETLKVSLPLADAAMAENARRLLRMVALPAPQAPLVDHIRHSITLLLPVGRATVGEVARNLNMTARALQRHLRSEGQTFARLLNEVRRDISRRHLRAPHHTLTEIAQSLGYSDQSSFTRWFDREFGIAPSAWRKAQRAAAEKPPPIWKR